MSTRINVGCGQSPTPGWVNFDNSLTVWMAGFWWIPRPKTKRAFADKVREAGIRWADATRLPVATGSLEVVYSSHMMEHMDRVEAGLFLDDAFRVLRPGGIIRLVLPDLRPKAEAYVRDGDADAFMQAMLTGMTRPHTFTEWLKHAFVGPRDHLWMYDGASLCRLLARHGFRDAAVLMPGETRIPRPGHLDLYERASESVFVEAFRP